MQSDRVSILVTAAGAEGTAGKILGLREAGYRVVAADIDRRAAGLYLADQAYVVPHGHSPDFAPEILRICALEGIRAIVPLVDEELVTVWALADHGVQILLPRAEIVARCLDKLTLMELLDESGVPVPRTRLATSGRDGMDFPVIVKPRWGRGSRGVFVAHDAAELALALNCSGDEPGRVIVQEYVEGPEYSASVVLWRDRRVQAVVPKEVVLKEGSSRYAISRHHPAVTEVCVKAAHVLTADGPLNVQTRVDASGTPRVFEINPRFSGSSTLTAAAGVDEIGGLLGQALDDDGSTLHDTWRDGVTMIRHSAETFVAESDFAQRRRSLRWCG
ncbi:ATP-grasp domain-containing protein [Nocardiopsis metallicus]|uniref:Carbamoyl-phosphate synthase large subunit n=1 Tax=Nocardiopsis metallicus TaxID=179819 RepID=A0A840WNH0_9ACTN|nr:ATP-grasp domain-containing protein [Nocardiopsis metallicus]MBB5494551.1 carbamoyl-phosphate synthase large subunit [Nocardiopsis metallicus]